MSHAATLTLSWDPPGDGVTAGYIVRYGTVPGNYTQTIDVGLVSSRAVTALAEGVRYYFAVQAYNANRQYGPLSNEVSGTATGTITAPAPPSNLAASVSGTTISLSWQAPADTVTGYRIEVGTGSGQANVTTINTGTASTYTVSAVGAATYYIRVRSVNTAGTSAPSNEVTATIASSTAPQPPSNLSATTRKKFVDLRWTAAPGSVTGYRIEIGTASGQSNVTTINTAVVSAYTVSSVADGSYYIRVRTVNGAVVSVPSNEVHVTVKRGKPESPSNLTADIRDGNHIELSWDADESADFYRVEVGTAPAQTDVSSFTTGATSRFTIGELPARTYYIRVRGGDESGFSEARQEVVIGGPDGNEAPRNLTGAATATGGVQLAWDVPQHAARVSGYIVEAGTAPGRADLATLRTSERALTSGPVAGGLYFVRVRTLTSQGPGPASNEIVVQAGAAQACTAPPGAPRLAAHVVGNQVTLSWSPGDGEHTSRYLLDVGTSPGRRDLATLPIAADVRTLTANAPDGSYALRLIAVNACGASAWDTTLTVGGPAIELPGAPVNLLAQVTGRAATLTWSPAAGGGDVSSYRIEVVAPSGDVLLSLDTGNTSTTFTHGDVPPGDYTVRVRGVNARGAGAASNTVVVSAR